MAAQTLDYEREIAAEGDQKQPEDEWLVIRHKLSSRCELQVHWIRSGKAPAIGPTPRLPDVVPPIRKRFLKGLLPRIIFCIPIDGNAVGVK